MKRASVVLLIAVAAVVAARMAVPAQRQIPAAVLTQLACGVERWNIKTLKDRPLLLRARPTTVTHLTSLRRPYVPARRRLLFERRIFTLIARVALKRSEDDLDYHLVLRTGSRTMIAETRLPAAPQARLPRGGGKWRQRVGQRGCVPGPASSESPSSTTCTGRPGSLGMASNSILSSALPASQALSPSTAPPPAGGK
jgi:hypothetical protein